MGFVFLSKFQHVTHLCTLESINALVVIAHHKAIGFVLPIINQFIKDVILDSTCILVFVDQNILKLLLVGN